MVLQLFQEVGVDHGDPVDLLDADPGLQGFVHGEDAPVVLVSQPLLHP